VRHWPRPGAPNLNLLQVQGVEVHRTEKEIRLPATESKGEGPGRAAVARAAQPDKSDAAKEDKKKVENACSWSSPVLAKMTRPDREFDYVGGNGRREIRMVGFAL
jgi:hypothetical protein